MRDVRFGLSLNFKPAPFDGDNSYVDILKDPLDSGRAELYPMEKLIEQELKAMETEQIIAAITGRSGDGASSDHD